MGFQITDPIPVLINDTLTVNKCEHISIPHLLTVFLLLILRIQSMTSNSFALHYLFNCQWNFPSTWIHLRFCILFLFLQLFFLPSFLLFFLSILKCFGPLLLFSFLFPTLSYKPPPTFNFCCLFGFIYSFLFCTLFYRLKGEGNLQMMGVPNISAPQRIVMTYLIPWAGVPSC